MFQDFFRTDGGAVVQYPFPDPEYDGEEPDRSVPPAAAGTGPDASDTGEDPVQGLFVCLPAEDLDVTRFAQHGESDSMPPPPRARREPQNTRWSPSASLAAAARPDLWPARLAA